MDSVKYIGMDVHKEAISIAVLNSSGKLVMESTIETKASTILDFLKGLRGSLHLTFEEGTWAAWLYDLIKPHVTELVVCNPFHPWDSSRWWLAGFWRHSGSRASLSWLVRLCVPRAPQSHTRP